MSKRQGRPKKRVRQYRNVGFGVTEVQRTIIEHKAAKAGVNLSDYMRQVAVHGVVKARWTEEERQMVKTLIGMSVDIHRLAEVARERGAVQTAILFSTYRDIMDSIIKELYEAFYEPGQIKERVTYRNDTIEGPFQSFTKNGDTASKGLFWRGVAVGPTYYYYDKDKLRLYNEYLKITSTLKDPSGSLMASDSIVRTLHSF